MAKKKIFLFMFAACASFTVLAGNMSSISAPTVADSVTSGEVQIAEVADIGMTPPVVPNVVQPAGLPNDALHSQPAAPDTNAGNAVVIEELPQESDAATEPVTSGQHAEGEPQSNPISRIEFGNAYVQSEWIDLPMVEHRSEVSELEQHGAALIGERHSVRAETPRFANEAHSVEISENSTMHSIDRTAEPDATGIELRLGRMIASFAVHPAGIFDVLPTNEKPEAAPESDRFVSEHVVSPGPEKAAVTAMPEVIEADSSHYAAANFDTGDPLEFQEMVRSAVEHFAKFDTEGFSFANNVEPAKLTAEHSSTFAADDVAGYEPAESKRTAAEHFYGGQGEQIPFMPIRETDRFASGHFAGLPSDDFARTEPLEMGRIDFGHFGNAVSEGYFAPVNVDSFADLAVAARHDADGLYAIREHEAETVGAKLFRLRLPAPETGLTSKADVLGPLSLSARTVAPVPALPLAWSVSDAPKTPLKKSSTPNVAETVRPLPALIDNKVAFSRTLLSPLPTRPDTTEFVPETVAMRGGPSINSPAAEKIATPSASTKTLPLLISSKTEFSAELLKPMKPTVVVSNPLSLPVTATKANAQQQQGYCDPGFVGDPIRFSQTVELRLEDLLSQLHSRFGVNFIMGPNIGKLPINVKAGSIPWNVLLRSQLFISGVRARCIDSNTIELIENSLLPNLQDSAGVETRFVKLKFLQRTTGGTVDLANRSMGGQNGGQGGCGGGVSGGGAGGGEIAGGGGLGGGRSGQTAAMQTSNRFDQLVQEVEKILGLRNMNGTGGGGGTIEGEERRTDRFVTQIPGRNILAIRATDDEHDLIAQIIERADRPPFQVVIKGLVYSANQDRIRDVGVNITGSNTGGRNTGGIFGDTLGVGTLFDFSTIMGTFDFNVQATAFQQNGVISVKSRPFATVIDGLCTTLSVGTKLPIVIDSTLGGLGGITILNADNLLAVTPYVVDDENGNPIAVTLDLNLQANVIDSSITARGVPAVNSKNIQTQLLLGPDKTAILGGFSIDQDSKSVQKVPGLGDIPILGELFKRRIQDQRLSRLYFAISAEVIPYPKAIEPVKVPGATTDPQTITEEMKKRAEAGEQKPVDPNAPYKKKDN